MKIPGARRIYDEPGAQEGARLLIDRLWPRGISKERAGIHFWAKEVAPSHELRRWYQHDPAKWPEFRRRYFAELDANPSGVAQLVSHLEGPATLVFSSRETELNNATALIEYLRARYP